MTSLACTKGNNYKVNTHKNWPVDQARPGPQLWQQSALNPKSAVMACAEKSQTKSAIFCSLRSKQYFTLVYIPEAELTLDCVVTSGPGYITITNYAHY